MRRAGTVLGGRGKGASGAAATWPGPLRPRPLGLSAVIHSLLRPGGPLPGQTAGKTAGCAASSNPRASEPASQQILCTRRNSNPRHGGFRASLGPRLLGRLHQLLAHPQGNPPVRRDCERPRAGGWAKAGWGGATTRYWTVRGEAGTWSGRWALGRRWLGSWLGTGGAAGVGVIWEGVGELVEQGRSGEPGTHMGVLVGEALQDSVDSSKGSWGPEKWGAFRGRAWRGLDTGGRAGSVPRGGACWGGAPCTSVAGWCAPPSASSFLPFWDWAEDP